MRFADYIYLLALAVIVQSCGDRESSPGGSGFIEATEVTLSAETGGQLVALYFDEGQEISANDTIGMIDTLTVMLKLRQAEAVAEAVRAKLQMSSINIKQATFNLDLARKEFERIASLIKSGSANQQQYDQLETAYNQARMAEDEAKVAYKSVAAELSQTRAQIDILKKQLDDCFPTSPLSGIVIEKFVEPGELVGTGQPLLRIAELDTVWVKVYLPPSDLTRIVLGGGAEVNPEDGVYEPLPGAVVWISDQAEFTPKNVQTKQARANLVYAVKIKIPNPERILKIGMPVLVRIR